MEKEKKDKLRYSVNRKSFFARLSATLMALSVMFRLLGYWGFWNNQSTDFIITQIALPILCNLLFIAVILTIGGRFFELTVIPVILGVIFFMIKSFGMGSVIHTILCLILYIVIAFVYTSVVFGNIRTKWVFLPLFGLPFIYQLLVEDRSTLLATESAMSVGEWLPELSVLCIMLALFFITFAMKKREPRKAADPSEEEIVEELIALEEQPEEKSGETASGDENE